MTPTGTRNSGRPLMSGRHVVRGTAILSAVAANRNRVRRSAVPTRSGTTTDGVRSRLGGGVRAAGSRMLANRYYAVERRLSHDGR